MEDIAVYQETLRQRQKAEQEKLIQRRDRAWQIAKQAAALLKQTFGAERVSLFGSLVHGHWFSTTSDIDLAVWGMDGLLYLTAIAQLQDLSPEFKIDLVKMESCKPHLNQVILQEGILL